MTPLNDVHVVNFSGGKDSTAMLLMMIEKGMTIDRIVNIDTTKEFPEMYEHIEKVKQYIVPYEITTTKIMFDYWFGEHIKTKGKRKGDRGYGWPDFRSRWCTSLKRVISRRGVRTEDKQNIIEYHGIAYDEIDRAKNGQGRNIKYPLIDWRITEKDALEYCYEKGFDWGGLYERRSRVSCYLCPLQRIGELRDLYNNRPELWNKMREMDKKSFRKYRSDYSLTELENKFDKENET